MLYRSNQLLKQPKIYNPAYSTKKKKFPKWILVVMLVLILILAIYYILFYSKIFTIKNIYFENSTNQTLANDFEKYKSKNIFLLNTEKIKNEILTKYPDITNLKIMRGLPDTLKIQLIDQEPKMIWQTNDKKFLVNKEGVIYKELTDETDLPIVVDNNNINVEIGKIIVSENFEKILLDLNATFANSLGFNILNYELNETLFQIDAVTDKGWKIKFDTTRKVADQLDDLKKFLASNQDEVKSYIDVRVEGKVFYK